MNRGRIMVVEDEDVQRLMMVETLEETGYEVDSFERPALALQQLEQERYDTLLTDFRMPGMTGLELIQHACPSIILSILNSLRILSFPFIPIDLRISSLSSKYSIFSASIPGDLNGMR